LLARGLSASARLGVALEVIGPLSSRSVAATPLAVTSGALVRPTAAMLSMT